MSRRTVHPGWAGTAAGLGIVALTAASVLGRTVLQTEWHSAAPAVLAWWAASDVLATAGAPLLFVAYGLSAHRWAVAPWRTVLLRVLLPCLALHGLSVAVVTGLTRYRTPGMPVPPVAEISALVALGVFPVVARLTRGVPRAVVLGSALVPLTVLTGLAIRMPGLADACAPAGWLACFLIGWRYRTALLRHAQNAAAWQIAASGAAFAVLAVLAAHRDPWDDLLRPVLGLAAAPVGVATAALIGRSAGSRLLSAAGRAAATICLVLTPATVLLDIVLVPRLSEAPAAAQIAAAVLGPVPAALAIVAAGILLRGRRPARGRPAPTAWTDPPRRALSLRATMTLAAGSALLVSAAFARAEPAGPADAQVTLAFGGDVHFQGRASALLDDPATAFGAAAPTLSAADVTVLNLETPITDRGQPEPKRYLFRTDPRAVTALRAAGVDAVSIANNHTLDYGRIGLADTIGAATRGGLGVFGGGRDVATAFAPWRTTVRGVRIAVFGFSQVDDLAETWAATPERAGLAMAFDVDRAVGAVAAARRDSDLIVVMPHWGAEGDPCPTARQQSFARRLADAGADIIVGAHAHVLQGSTTLGGTFVQYGLGNLLWYSSGLHAPFTARAGVLTLTVRARTVRDVDFTPTVVSGTGAPQPLDGWRAALARRNAERLRSCA